MSTICPCGSAKEFTSCCQLLIDGGAAAGPEDLMRSRYTAFVMKNLDYIAATTDPQAIGEFDFVATREWAEKSEFHKLEILNSSNEGNKGTVEFKAHYRMDGAEHVHHELSKFRKHQGIWYFRDARLMSVPGKPG
jgi:SEC-C motif domain protein